MLERNKKILERKFSQFPFLREVEIDGLNVILEVDILKSGDKCLNKLLQSFDDECAKGIVKKTLYLVCDNEVSKINATRNSKKLSWNDFSEKSLGRQKTLAVQYAILYIRGSNGFDFNLHKVAIATIK